MFVSDTQTWNWPVNRYQHVANLSLPYSPRFLFLMTLEKYVSPLFKKMLWVGPVLYLLPTMPTALTYQAFSMYQALHKTLQTYYVA